ncbi:hypothetical protein [Burkholderia multivorans]|uniref:hypothetical protein n=1 Tax=Burkholderia multivorans TaxID=87883 RepID=UPI001F27232E|nr:hypothetical protein [Burkholderia multivorans]
MSTNDAQNLLLDAGAECMSPEQYEAFEMLLATQQDLSQRFANCMMKRLHIEAPTDAEIESEARLYSLDLYNGLDWCFDDNNLKAFIRALKPVWRVTIAGVDR